MWSELTVSRPRGEIQPRIDCYFGFLTRCRRLIVAFVEKSIKKTLKKNFLLQKKRESGPPPCATTLQLKWILHGGFIHLRRNEDLFI